jgi:hypothetical protein
MKRHGRVNVRALPRAKSPLNFLPPRKTRFGPPLVPSRVHWVKPKLVAEITYLTWKAMGSCGKRFTCGCARTSRQSGSSEKLHGLSRRKRTKLDQRKTVRSRRILFSNGSRVGALRVSTLSGASVFCVLVRHLMG